MLGYFHQSSIVLYYTIYYSIIRPTDTTVKTSVLFLSVSKSVRVFCEEAAYQPRVRRKELEMVMDAQEQVLPEGSSCLGTLPLFLLSLRHVDRVDVVKLQTDSHPDTRIGDLIVSAVQGGYLIQIPTYYKDPAAEIVELRHQGYSEAFVNLMLRAWMLGAVYTLILEDGPVFDELPTF